LVTRSPPTKAAVCTIVILVSNLANAAEKIQEYWQTVHLRDRKRESKAKSKPNPVASKRTNLRPRK